MVESILVQYTTVDQSFNKACNTAYLTALVCFIVKEAFMLFTSNSDPAIRISQQTFFQSSVL